MAVTLTSCKLIRPGHTGSFEPYGRRSYTATWRLVVQEANGTPPEVLVAGQAAGGSNDPLPALYATYAIENGSDTASYCKKIDVSRQDASKHGAVWVATAHYSRLEPNERTQDDATAPVSRSIRYSLEFEPITQLVEKAYNETILPRVKNRDVIGKLGPVVNAAGKEFSQPLFEDSHRTVLVIQRNLATIAKVYGVAHAYDRTLNNKPWLGFPKGHARFIGIETTGLVNEQGNEYYPCTIRVELGREPFFRELVNQGFQELDEDGNPVEIKDKDGANISEDWLLDIQGRAFPRNADTNPPQAVTIKYRTAQYQSYDYLTSLTASLPKVPSFS